MRLIQMAPDAKPVWMTELEKIQAKAAGQNFMDMYAYTTETEDLGSLAPVKFTQPKFQKPRAINAVKRVIKELSTDGPKENLQTFTSFRTRHYRSQWGRDSQKWLAERIFNITSEFAPKGLREHITISEFPHSWGQNTIVVRINGSLPYDDGVVIVGAHQDRADDDGSGTVTILEAYRALITLDFRPRHAVEFQWYSGEEGGLLGSQEVAKNYESRGVNVLAMNQAGTKEAFGIVTDFVDPELTEANKELVNTYLDIPYVETSVATPVAITRPGIRLDTAAPSRSSTFEDSNPNIHSGNDRIDISPEFSFTHMLEFSKFAVAFVIELAGWTKNE
ncbi:hypothetical protein BGW80DRAFT_1557591 [Lactifluus volemus]|nr:hypothetical protein BGW80DRAFT_1557591 [Lactifluus volemus]